MDNGQDRTENIITISDDDEYPPRKVLRMSRNSQQQPSGSSDDVIILDDDTPPQANAGYDSDFSDHQLREGKTLGAMRNALVLSQTWPSAGFDVRGKRIVVLEGDNDCIKQGEEHGAQSVAVFKQFPAKGIEANVFALTHYYVKDQPTRSAEPGNPWPCWPMLEESSSSGEKNSAGTEDEHFAVVIKEISTKQDGVEQLQTVQVRRVAGGKLEEVGKKDFTCDFLLIDEDHLDLTTECYALSSFQALYRP